METTQVLFLYGNDEFAIARKLDDLQIRHDRDGLNTAYLDAHQVGDEELNKAVNAMPFLGQKRLVFLSNPSARTSDPVLRRKFLDFLLAAPPTTMIVLHELVDPKDFNKHWLVKRAEKGGIGLEALTRPRDREMPGWIVNETRRQKGQIEFPAATRLAEMVGEDTRQAAQEITKLLTYVNYSRPVSLADVEVVSIVTDQGDIFALVDAIGTGNGKKAQKVLHQLLEEEDAMALWGMVIRQFRLLLQAREILAGRGSSMQVQGVLRLHEYVAGKITEQASRFTLPALEAIYHKLLEMDAAAKTSQVPLDLALDMLIVEMTKK